MQSELQSIQTAVTALEDAYQAVFEVAHIGMTTDQIDAVIEQRLASHGAKLPEKRATSTPFVVAADGLPPKLRINRVPLERDKLWAMDTSVHVDGCWADLGRYAWFGSLPQHIGEAHNRLLARQELIAHAIRPGMGMDEIYKVIPPGPRFEIHRIGSEPHLMPFCGDVIPAVTEKMDQSVAQGLVYETGQVICIELWAGMVGGIEDMYRVEVDGVARISSSQRCIREIKVDD